MYNPKNPQHSRQDRHTDEGGLLCLLPEVWHRRMYYCQAFARALNQSSLRALGRITSLTLPAGALPSAFLLLLLPCRNHHHHCGRHSEHSCCAALVPFACVHVYTVVFDGRWRRFNFRGGIGSGASSVEDVKPGSQKKALISLIQDFGPLLVHGLS